MVHHLVAWRLKPELSPEEKTEAARRMKQELESLQDKIDGIRHIRVVIEPMRDSNRDILLDSAFDDEDALNAYQIHPEHTHISRYIGSVACERVCFDYGDPA